MTDPLQLPLKDIHLPQDPGWWPPAPGWWILLGLVILSAAATYCLFRRRQRLRRSAVYQAKLQFEALQGDFDAHKDARRFIADLSVLLRRLSISAFPRNETASLTGEDWLKFLDRVVEKPVFSEGPGRILIEAPYRPLVSAEELTPLLQLCKEWIDQLAKNKPGALK